MKKLQILTATAGVLFALSGSSFATTRTHHSAAGNAAYARGLTSDRSGPYYYGPRGTDAYAAAPRVQNSDALTYSYGAQQNLPYPDRPYGDPDRW
jgi:hypothetical protein